MFEKKRKRDDDRQNDSGRIELRRGDVRRQQEYLEKLLQGSKRLLAQALKLARGFERQKLGRRQKTAKGAANVDESKRLVAEVKALKVCLTSFVAYQSLTLHQVSRYRFHC